MIKYKQGNHPNSHKHNTIKNLGGYAKKGIMIGHKAAHYEKLHIKVKKLENKKVYLLKIDILKVQ